MKSFIGLGSNLGEREAMIRQALEEITRLPGTQLLRASSLYDTEPVGEVDQPNFLNAVAQIDTELTARQLLWNLLLIEKRLGRVRTQRYGWLLAAFIAPLALMAAILLIMILAGAGSTEMTAVTMIFGVPLLLVPFILLVVHLARGRTVRCTLQTAVQNLRLRPLTREAKAQEVMA